MKDTIPDIDSIYFRFSIGIVKKSHGGCFMDFLKDNTLCVLSSKATPTLSDYIFISYLICGHCKLPALFVTWHKAT